MRETLERLANGPAAVNGTTWDQLPPVPPASWEKVVLTRPSNAPFGGDELRAAGSAVQRLLLVDAVGLQPSSSAFRP